MPKSKEELLLHAIRMRERGETYRSVSIFLKNNTAEESDISDIVAAISKLEETEKIKIQTNDKKAGSKLDYFLGVLFLASGGVLMVYLWDRGFISTIPFLLIGIGLWALTGKLK